MMALDWNGYLIKIAGAVQGKADSVEARTHKQIFFAGAVVFVLIVAWKVLK